MSRPDAVVVLGQPFSIEYVAAGAFAGETYGRTDHALQRITVRTDCSPHQERDTVMHELLHAAGDIVGQSLGETVVGAIAPVLLDVLRANPAVVAYLTERIQ